MNPYIFISYNHSIEDKEFVTNFTRKLEKAGIDYFLDQDIKYGENIPDTVAKALKRASHVIAFLSPGAEKSQWVFFEIGIAFSHSKIIVLRLIHSQMTIPSFLSNAKYISNFEDEDSFINQIKPSKEPQNVLEEYIEKNIDFNNIDYFKTDRFEDYFFCIYQKFDGDDTLHLFWNNKTKRLSKSYLSYSGVRWTKPTKLDTYENRLVCEVLKIPNSIANKILKET